MPHKKLIGFLSLFFGVALGAGGIFWFIWNVLYSSKNIGMIILSIIMFSLGLASLALYEG
jgi:hypothetical protein